MSPGERRDLSLLSLLSVGTVLVSCIVLGYLLGHWLDGKWGTDPWLGVVGVVLGSLAGFLELFRTVSRTLK
jgi:ATP synthase protein I